MQHKRLWSILVVLLLASAATFAEPPAAGEPAPDFTLPSNGQFNLNLSEQRGSLVAIVFWASWCRSCPAQLRAFEALQEKHSKHPLTIWSIALDKDKSSAEQYVQQEGLRLPVLFDQDARVSKTFDINDLPVTYIVDWDGNIRYFQNGYEPDDAEKFDGIMQELFQQYPQVKRAL